MVEKFVDGYYRFHENVVVSDGVSLAMSIDKIDGEELDTQVFVTGGFCICGSRRREFSERLGKLIDEYRI